MKAEYERTKFIIFEEAVEYIKRLNTQTTETTYDNGRWINRISKITLKRHNGFWVVVESLKVV